jgi:hypothetical protein
MRARIKQYKPDGFYYGQVLLVSGVWKTVTSGYFTKWVCHMELDEWKKRHELEFESQEDEKRKLL